jgi:hypothetical protein
MSAQLGTVQMKWTKKLGEALQENRYAFHAALSPQPDETWKRCFREIVKTFNRTSPFEASIHGSEAIVFGPLRAFENLLSRELESAISQTNDLYKRRLDQEAIQKQQHEIHWEQEEKIREDLKRKFVWE